MKNSSYTVQFVENYLAKNASLLKKEGLMLLSNRVLYCTAMYVYSLFDLIIRDHVLYFVPSHNREVTYIFYI